MNSQHAKAFKAYFQKQHALSPWLHVVLVRTNCLTSQEGQKVGDVPRGGGHKRKVG